MGNKYSKNNRIIAKKDKSKEKILQIIKIWSNGMNIPDIDVIILKYYNFTFNMHEWKELSFLQNKIVCHRWGYFFYLKNRHYNGRIIIKTFDKKIKSKMIGSSKAAFNKEYYILNKISHKNIVHMLCKYSDVNNNCIIYRCNGGQNLSDIVTNDTININESLCKYFVKDMLNVYKYLDSMGMYHSNLKISTYMFKYNFDYKCINNPNSYSNSLLLTNFDSCMIIKDYDKKYRRTIVNKSQNNAPELYLDKSFKVTGKYVKTADIYSIGVIIYAILFKRFPGDDSKDSSVSNPVTDECTDFVSNLLEKDYKKRININDALQHEWLQIQ